MLKLIAKIAKQPVTEETISDIYSLTAQLQQREDIKKWCRWIRKQCKNFNTPTMYEMYYRTYRLEAQHGVFDAYCIYLEKNRPAEEKFYLPRRRVLKILVDDLQDLFDGKIKFLGISLPPRVGKSTLGIIFMTFIMGHRPEIANVMSGFSDKLTEGFYNEILSIIMDSEKYCWNEVFPGLRVADKSAKNETIDIKNKKRFSTMTCRSVTGTLTGAVEIGNGGVLYCDDLVEDLEESLNIDRLNNKYDAYLNQLKDRKKNNAFELMVGTRWNVFDPLGRIQAQYGDNPKYRFRVIPALNENDESNFVYDYELGFSTEYYHDMRDSIDPATWWAKYMGQPYIREGLLLPEQDLQFYNGVLPDGEPDYKCFVCDVAFGGGDYLALPIAYVYGDVAFIHDVAFNNGDKTVTKPIVMGKLKQHMPSFGRFEANNGGDAYAEDINRMLRDDGVRINITSKRAPNNKSKLARIIQYAPDIKRFYFRDRNNRDAEYNKFMDNVTTFTQDGKNKNDDAPDSLAMLADLMNSGMKKATAYKRPV